MPLYLLDGPQLVFCAEPGPVTAAVIVGKSSIFEVSGTGSSGFRGARELAPDCGASHGAPRTTKPFDWPFVFASLPPEWRDG